VDRQPRGGSRTAGLCLQAACVRRVSRKRGRKRTFPYRTNAHGLRDRDRPAKAPGTKRVLVMGDSYTWGYAIAEEEAYPQVAERLLAQRGRPDIEVINGGIPTTTAGRSGNCWRS
jgi:hypothetical protein